jgi:uncharacterized damage-inducible protein DinB
MSIFKQKTTMSLNQTLLPEFQQEATSTRNILALVPYDNPDWKPHEKSMKLSALAAHVAEIPTWVGMIVNMDELDFAKMDYKPPVISNNAELLDFFDKHISDAVAVLQNASDEQLMGNWTMRNGERIFFTMPRMAALRTWCMNHVYHHRAQLGVYLRMNNIPLPFIYGPTADNQDM